MSSNNNFKVLIIDKSEVLPEDLSKSAKEKDLFDIFNNTLFLNIENSTTDQAIIKYIDGEAVSKEDDRKPLKISELIKAIKEKNIETSHIIWHPGGKNKKEEYKSLFDDDNCNPINNIEKINPKVIFISKYATYWKTTRDVREYVKKNLNNLSKDLLDGFFLLQMVELDCIKENQLDSNNKKLLDDAQEKLYEDNKKMNDFLCRLIIDLRLDNKDADSFEENIRNIKGLFVSNQNS